MKTMTDILQAARDLVQAGWTQEAYARNATGDPVDASSPAAVCHCAFGALLAAGDQAGIDGRRMLGHSIKGCEDDPAWACALDFVVKAAQRSYASRGQNPAGHLKGSDALVRYNDHATALHMDAVAWFDAALAEAASE